MKKRAPPTAAIATARGEAGFLAALWRQILTDLNIDSSLYEHAVNTWISKQQSSNPYEQVHRRGNLRRELSDDKMTFKVFVRALKIVGANRVDISIRLTFANKRVTTHQRSMILLDMLEGFDDDERPIPDELEEIAQNVANEIDEKIKEERKEVTPPKYLPVSDWILDGS
jgi:hypothetical protein